LNLLLIPGVGILLGLEKFAAEHFLYLLYNIGLIVAKGLEEKIELAKVQAFHDCILKFVNIILGLRNFPV
jgi:flagellin-specific chaperone FliS